MAASRHVPILEGLQRAVRTPFPNRPIVRPEASSCENSAANPRRALATDRVGVNRQVPMGCSMDETGGKERRCLVRPAQGRTPILPLQSSVSVKKS